MIATNNKKNFTSHKSNQSNSYMYVLCQSVFPPTASLALQLANSILSSYYHPKLKVAVSSFQKYLGALNIRIFMPAMLRYYCKLITAHLSLKNDLFSNMLNSD